MQEVLVDAWSRQPQFSADTLATLHDLNHRFLDLLAEGRPRWSAAQRDPDAALARELRRLAAPHRAALARCPYALFDLRLDDEAHWRARLATGSMNRVEDRAPIAEEEGEFARLALFYAWHVAVSEPESAQVLLGMHAQTAAALRGVTLNGLTGLAAAGAAALAPRFFARRTFWSALVSAAARGDAHALRRVQLFGLQLSAAVRLG